MEFELKIEHYDFSVVIDAKYEKGEVIYTANCLNGSMMSNWDRYSVFEGNTIEDAIQKIAKALKKTVDLQKQI